MQEALLADAGSFQMWFTLFLILGAVLAYANDRLSLEITSLVVIATLLTFFYYFPVFDNEGNSLLTTERLLMGFANPALIAVLSLLILGQAVVRTGALSEVAGLILRISGNSAMLSISVTLIVVMFISALLNNTPVVVIFIPIIASLAKSLDISVSKVMMPLSFASILGGMLTLIGSSTNLLVAGQLEVLGLEPLGFFDFTLPGLFIVAVGLLYIVFFAPHLLPDRASLVRSLVDDDDRKFVAQIEIEYGSDFAGQTLKDGSLAEFPDVTVRMIQRGEHAFLAPFEEDMVIQPRDIIVASASRKDLTELFSKVPHKLLTQTAAIDDEDDDIIEEGDQELSMAEVVIAPASRMIGQNLEQIGFHRVYNCVVLGIQRQSRVIRARVTEIRLAAGDVLLVMGRQEDILKLHETNDLLLLEWSTEEIHLGQKAKLTAAIFFGVVGLAALNVVPITIAAVIGVAGVLLTQCLNIRQAARALDMKIILIIAAALAMGASLQATGGALYIANLLISIMAGAHPVVIMSALFLLMAAMTNVLSNNASAVLFTPIAVNVAAQLGVDPTMFIFAVIFACNCSFATPIGYQTNLLVMGPGHHKFSDFMRAGIPLALIIWLTYTGYAYWFFS